jgi:hypothetical protein
MLKVKLTKDQAQTLTRKLWQIVTTTPGVGMLSEPLQRAEYQFDRLSRGQRITVGVLATLFVEAVYATIPQQVEVKEETKETVAETKESNEGQEVKETVAETKESNEGQEVKESKGQEPITPDEIIRPC